ncbi:MAG: sensor histidine kinase [Nocardioidaceae bacterium]
MTRRILAALLALTGALVGAVVLPLGFETAAHYRRDYADAAIAQATAVAGVTEERLSDHESGAPLQGDLRKFVIPGEGVLLLNSAGTRIASAGSAFPVPSGLIAANTATTASVDVGGETMLLAAVPVGSGTNRAGIVVLARPTEPLDSRVHTLWSTLAGIAVVAAAAAVFLAVWLSRWVARPLRRLEQAAQFVGAGDLEARAGSLGGPLEVRRLAGTFDAMAGRLNTLLDGHRAVIADVSHQLRTPMSALRLRLELLAEQDPRSRIELTGALAELNRLSRLVDGLLAVARAEATGRRPTPINTRAVIAERAAAWHPLAAEHGVDLTLKPGPDADTSAVPGHLEQILDNLLGNCFDLEPPPHHVTMQLSGHDDTVTITVADDGPGMTSTLRQSAFQRFATDHADTGGTGLGLAIVHRLITANGGTVNLTETPGGGLTVAFTLRHAPRSQHLAQTQ